MVGEWPKWCCLVQCAVGACLRWRRLRISIRSSSSRRAVPIHRSAIAFARGACTGCAQDADALAGEHGIEDAGELAVAIPDQEREGRRAVPRSISRFRACWATQAPLGFAVMPRTCTRRVACSTTNSTKRWPVSTRRREPAVWCRVRRQPHFVT